MAEPAQHARQSHPPVAGTDGSSVRDATAQIEGLLDNDGHYNPNPDTLSRGHPDYVEGGDNRAPDRDTKGRFRKKESGSESEELALADQGSEQDENTREGSDTDTSDTGDTDNLDERLSADEDAESNDADTESIETLDGLASALEVPIAELKEQITHTFKAADGEVTVTLAEMEKGYQKDADYRRQTGKLAETKRAVEADYRARVQNFEAQSHIANQNFTFAEQAITSELNDPRLMQLRESDPAEWTARREEISNRLHAVRNAKQQAAVNYNNVKSQHLAGLVQREQEALNARIPDWSDGHRDIAKSTLTSMGFDAGEIDQVYDHRLIMGVLEVAALRNEVKSLREMQSKAKDSVKRVKKDVPKLQKPGKQRAKSGARVKKDTLSRLRGKARDSGSVGDAAKVIEHLL